MKLKMFALTPRPPRVAPAPRTRAWMDAFPGRHAYRCLPLNIANGYGWQLLSPHTFTVRWDGGAGAQNLVFEAENGAPYLDHFVNSNFTHGIVTFHTGYLFRTDPGWRLAVMGPPNLPKDGIVPLTGIVETDWLPYPFTMNWQVTRPGVVRFEEGEPFCHVFPVPAGALEAVEPEILDMEDDPELADQYRAWREKRDQFMAGFRAGDPATIKEAWQKFYFSGTYPDGSLAAAPHSAKIDLRDPVDRRGRR